MSTHSQARSPEVDELSGVPETRQSQEAAGVEEVVVGVVDPLEMSGTEPGDIALETQQDSDSSDDNIADTLGQRCLPKMVSEPANTLWKGHSH